jgi:hypothetical protein
MKSLVAEAHQRWAAMRNFKMRLAKRANTVSLMVLLVCASLSACGPCLRPPPPQPARPFKIDGWNKTHDKEAGVTYCAVLVLKKGESSDNGRIGVRVTSILEGDACCGDPAPRCNRRANVQFFRPQDNRLLCEMEVPDNSNSTIPCAEEVGSQVIGVWGINTQEGWVLLDLRC